MRLRRDWFFIPVLIGLAAAVTFFAASRIDDIPLKSDAFGNATIALNVARHGTFALVGEDPTMAREPVPIWFMAGYIALSDGLRSAQTIDEVNADPQLLHALKAHNLVVVVLLLLAVPVLLAQFFGRGLLWFGLSCATMIAIHVAFVASRWPPLLNSTLTEIHAAALLLWTAAASAVACRRRKPYQFLLLGVLCGALALTKGVFVYITLPYVAILCALLMAGRGGVPVRRGLAAFVVTTIGAAVVVTPWIARNYVCFGSMRVAERGGAVLWTRAVKDGMTDEERRGALYAYAPRGIQPLVGGYLGYSPADVQAGGRLQRLERTSNYDHDSEAAGLAKPEDAISYYFQALAETNRQILELGTQPEQAGLSYSDLAVIADRILEKRAIEKILADPSAHLRTTPLFFWRGVGTMESDLLSDASNAYTSILGMAALVSMVLVSLVRRDAALFGVVGLAFGMVLFYSAFSHNLPRYTAPAIPVMVVAAAIYVGWLSDLGRRVLPASRSG